MKARILIVAACLAALANAAPAKEVARSVGPASAVILYSDRGGCDEGSAEAMYLDRNQQVRGCWFERFDRIWIFYDDGDHTGLQRSIFTFAVDKGA
jgi:hypothetical protein